MLNTLASYLWGSAPEAEQGYTEAQSSASEGEHLNTQHDGDWVVVDAGNDKENCSNLSCHHHHQHHSTSLPHRPHPSHHGDGCDSCPCSPSTPSASDTEQLDDAASLIDSLGLREMSNQLNSEVVDGPLREKFLAYGDTDSNCSSDDEESVGEHGMRPSSPESVFSTCSGRSHATYRARGHASEPWVMAPPPCFMFNPADDCPQANRFNPMENLLIEHPSMSVYLTGPGVHSTFTPISSSGSATHENAQRLTEGEVQERVEDPVHTDSTAVQRQQTPRSRALHSIGVHNVITPEQMVKQVRSARRVQRQKHQRSINKQKCERQNKVEHLSQYNKGKNKQNKCAHPSGFKASRNTQRM